MTDENIQSNYEDFGWPGFAADPRAATIDSTNLTLEETISAVDRVL